MGKGRNGLENEQSALFATVVSLGAALWAAVQSLRLTI